MNVVLWVFRITLFARLLRSSVTVFKEMVRNLLVLHRFDAAVQQASRNTWFHYRTRFRWGNFSLRQFVSVLEFVPTIDTALFENESLRLSRLYRRLKRLSESDELRYDPLATEIATDLNAGFVKSLFLDFLNIELSETNARDMRFYGTPTLAIVEFLEHCGIAHRNWAYRPLASQVATFTASARVRTRMKTSSVEKPHGRWWKLLSCLFTFRIIQLELARLFAKAQYSHFRKSCSTIFRKTLGFRNRKLKAILNHSQSIAVSDFESYFLEQLRIRSLRSIVDIVEKSASLQIPSKEMEKLLGNALAQLEKNNRN